MNYVENAKKVFEIESAGIEYVKGLLNDEFNKVVDAILKSQGRVVITGMGKSGLVGKKMTATLASTGTAAFFIHPGEAYHGDLGMIHSSDIIIAISNSGETEELIRLLNFFSFNGNKVVAMCGKKNSTLVSHADYFLNIAIEKEACPLELAPTTSTTVTMVMGDALAIALMEAKNFRPENFARFHPGGSLGRKLLIKVKDVMRIKDIPSLSLNDDFKKVITTISSGRLGIGVVLEGNNIISVITDGDIRRLLEKEGAKAIDLQVKDFCGGEPISIDANEKIAVAESLMQEKKITALVVKENNKFVGIVQRYDI